MDTFWAVLVMLAIPGLYIGSLWINPWVKCSRCNGTVTKKGLLFKNAFHACPRCKGTGRQIRLGRKFIFGPPK